MMINNSATIENIEKMRKNETEDLFFILKQSDIIVLI